MHVLAFACTASGQGALKRCLLVHVQDARVSLCLVLLANKLLKKEVILYPSLALHGISNNLLAIYTPGMLITLLLHSPNNSANIREQKQASYQVA